MIMGVIGPIGSGKDFVSKHLKEKHGFGSVHMGNLVRMLAKKEGLALTRENLRKTQEKYHKKYGDDFLINLALKKINQKKYRNAIITGIRTSIQAKVAKDAGTKIVLVDAKPELRFERSKKRGRKGFSKTLKEFIRQEEQENKFFDLDKLFRMANFRVDNNGTKEQLLSQVEMLLSLK